MKSAWLINFKNGNKIICTEEIYENFIKNIDIKEIDSEEHWFKIEECINKNPNVLVIK